MLLIVNMFAVVINTFRIVYRKYKKEEWEIKNWTNITWRTKNFDTTVEPERLSYVCIWIYKHRFLDLPKYYERFVIQ